MRRLLRIVIYWISFVIKQRSVLVFSSYPDFSDNPYALYLYLLKNKRYDKYKKVWILENPSFDVITAIRNVDSHAIISRSTLKNWYYVIISRYIFSSHNAYSYLHFHQKDKLFNLWHGLPLKKIGFDNGETPSTFYESLLQDSLQSTLTDEELLVYRVMILDDMVATVSRQVAEYRFEQDLHKNYREK